ncbi:MAG TPA: hypothetical protein VK066_06405 [Chloroflexota bacterium]|nr:hypothetical protein [Chloroflexota bacterium]
MDDAFIARYVEEAPDHPGPANARLADSGVPIWALIGYLRAAAHGDVAQAAADYRVPVEAVRAAVAYYERACNRPLIDALIALNAA